METKHKIFRIAAIGGGIASVALALAYLAGNQLYINGSLASSSVIEVKGVAYVPVKDVAKATGMTLAKTNRGYEMSPAGGAGMVHGLEGRVGDELFNGFHRFKIIEVIRGKKYTNRFSGDNQEVTAYPEANDLVVLICRVKNGTKGKITFALPSGSLTGLTDMDEHSFAPRNGLSADIPTRGAELLPGAAVDFALTFDVPPSAVLKDLVYDAADYDNHHPKPFRVSLKQ